MVWTTGEDSSRGPRGAVNARGTSVKLFYVVYLNATWHQNKEPWFHSFNTGMGIFFFWKDVQTFPQAEDLPVTSC